MGKHNARQKLLSQRRQEVAVEAARIMAEEGVRNHLEAKTRAAQRLGVSSDAALPRNSEVEAAFRQHLMLFKSDSQPQLLQALRATALEAMDFFDRFRPRLVGAVLDGSADEHSAICLHLFAETDEEIGWFLDDNGIPFDIESRNLRRGDGSECTATVYQFVADNYPVDITCLPPAALREAPKSRIDGNPIQRASRKQLINDNDWMQGQDAAGLLD